MGAQITLMVVHMHLSMQVHIRSVSRNSLAGSHQKLDRGLGQTNTLVSHGASAFGPTQITFFRTRTCHLSASPSQRRCWKKSTRWTNSSSAAPCPVFKVVDLTISEGPSRVFVSSVTIKPKMKIQRTH